MDALRDELQTWPAEGEIFDLSSAALEVLAGEHPFLAAHREAVAANWEQEVAANPALFNGRFLLFSTLGIHQGRLCGQAHDTPYAAMLYWRRSPALQTGYHVFCFPVIITADNALVAVEMAAHTANPGQVYCPAGSLELEDVVDGRVDIEANMRREVREETGLDLGMAEADGALRGLRLGRRVTLFRIFRMPLTADQVEKAIYRHMETDHEQEIARPVLLRRGDEGRYPFNPAMKPLLHWLFAD
ncbi:NUDIX hydrolase [Allorhizobium undicola]|uniref:NUDIX hydrolase n=1 Tax=Allorhizobium undicola TaxID=78527 RepID=UPI00048A157B|nr:NUDIX hydrolase [Allorhizobium undicola]